MHTHEPRNYNCPLCTLVRGEDDDTNKQEYIVYQDEVTIAYVSPKWWVHNPGHVIVIPKKHLENIYTIPDEALSNVYLTAKKIAIAIKETYQCDGTSMRQHNEPAGNQDVWHFHVHVFPRFVNDDLYKNYENTYYPEHNDRMQFVMKLKKYFS